MDSSTAAAYLGLRENTFRTVVGRRGLAPVALGLPRTVRWRKSDLDDLVAGLPARGSRATSGDSGASIDPDEIAALGNMELEERNAPAEALARVSARAARAKT